MEFQRVNIGDKKIFDEFLRSKNIINDRYTASELNFASVICWNVSENIRYAVESDAIYIRTLYGGRQLFLPPIVKEDRAFFPAVKRLEALAREEGIPFIMVCLTREMTEVLGREKHGYDIQYNRDNSEYLYAPQDLITLPGKKFNEKRNHLNFFRNNYEFEYMRFTGDSRQDIINLEFEWKAATGNFDPREDSAIDNAIAYHDELNLKCGCIRIGGKLVAFSAGFITPTNVGIVLFEKADTAYRGAYQAINQQFAQNEMADCLYINRQEDMGIEGLRRAKLSYNPVAMCDKFDIVGVKR